MQTQSRLWEASVAQLVEHNLAKVGAAGSSPVTRSTFFLLCPGGGTGRRAGLKILWAVMPVSVRVRPWAQESHQSRHSAGFFIIRTDQKNN